VPRIAASIHKLVQDDTVCVSVFKIEYLFITIFILFLHVFQSAEIEFVSFTWFLTFQRFILHVLKASATSLLRNVSKKYQLIHVLTPLAIRIDCRCRRRHFFYRCLGRMNRIDD